MHRGGRDRVLASSFDAAALRMVRALRPEHPDGARDRRRRRHRSRRCRGRAGAHRAIHPKSELIDRLFVEHARALGLALHAWTVNDADEVARLARLGIDGVITDVPDIALAAHEPQTQSEPIRVDTRETIRGPLKRWAIASCSSAARHRAPLQRGCPDLTVT